MKRALIIIAVLAGVLLLYVHLSGGKFRERVEREKQRIASAERKPGGFGNDAMQPAGLPAPVKKYLRHALSSERTRIKSVRMVQTGSFRSGETGNWVPVNADQVTSVEDVAFVWHARLQPHPYLWTESRDLLYGGQARTEHRLYAAFSFRFAAGREEDLSALARFLVEAPWYPTALVPGGHLEWKPIDDRSAKAVLTDHGYQVSAVFTFSEKGEIIKATTDDRYRTKKRDVSQVPWTAHFKDYQERGGMRIPMEVEAEWGLPDRTFPYWKVRVQDISFVLF